MSDEQTNYCEQIEADAARSDVLSTVCLVLCSIRSAKKAVKIDCPLTAIGELEDAEQLCVSLVNRGAGVTDK